MQASTNEEVAGGMSALEEKREDETGCGTVTGETDDAPEHDEPRTREPVSEEEAEQDNYANTADEES